MLEDGDKAPEFDLPTESGETIGLARLKGKAFVLYFYPKDDTSGCTAEAKDFTRLAPEFRKARLTSMNRVKNLDRPRAG